ncbi:MAG TPA: aldehyde dehydrogenase family protein, partial [Capillimicrobium sp.]
MTAETLEIRSPASGELLATVPMADDREVEAAVASAGRGAAEMRRLPAHERAAMLARVAEAIEGEGEALARLLASENGKPIRQTRGEVAAAVRIFRGFGEEAKRLFGRQIPLDAVPGLERHLAVTFREPLGVVAAIVPFNYPLELYAHKAAAALAAGNAVVVKPPEKCPLTVLRVAELVAAAGCPPDAHRVVVGGPRAAQQLAASPGVQLVTLTGSTAAGRAISELAAQTLKKVHLELGGNDPMIVCADADLD